MQEGTKTTKIGVARQLAEKSAGENPPVSASSSTIQYPKPDWAVQQLTRASGLVEDVCKHGSGHPNGAWLKKHDSKGEKGMGIHGCDGCCSKKIKERISNGS